MVICPIGNAANDPINVCWMPLFNFLIFVVLLKELGSSGCPVDVAPRAHLSICQDHLGSHLTERP